MFLSAVIPKKKYRSARRKEWDKKAMDFAI
jgi:hypothetical protein